MKYKYCIKSNFKNVNKSIYYILKLKCMSLIIDSIDMPLYRKYVTL